jgi:hypothetical protein
MATDGTVDWTGGMDAARLPYLIENNKFHRACNIRIDRKTGQLKNRFGFECIKLIGSDDDICIYNHCKNLQAEGYYRDGLSIVLVRLIDGYIIELHKITDNKYKVIVRNPDDRRNPLVSKAWITTVPRGVIIQDGQALPHIVRKDSIRRSVPSNKEIGVGRMGIYIQNRYFYVDSNGKLIWASNFRNPESIEEGEVTNIWGFMLPDDDDSISAIGARKQTLNYVEGGTLSFSTINNTYSVDVRGNRENWEVGNTSLGKVQESIPGIGAVSSYSYEPFSSNLYFRSLEDGVMDLRSTEDQFQRGEVFSSQSTELLEWLDRDSQRLLSKCYTKRFGHRLLTTVAPSINKHGYCYWNGMVSMMPEPIHANQKLPTIYEGLITGVRPWCITSYSDNSVGHETFIDSYDPDGITRLYRLNIKLDHDIDKDGNRKEIESWIETKGYVFGDLQNSKKTETREISLLDIPRDIHLKVYSRTDIKGQWIKFVDQSHYVSRYKPQTKNFYNKPVFRPIGSSSQSRSKIMLPNELDTPNPHVSSMAGRQFLSRQYRIEIKGAYSLAHLIINAELSKEASQSVTKLEDKNVNNIYRQNNILDYTYTIE